MGNKLPNSLSNFRIFPMLLTPATFQLKISWPTAFKMSTWTLGTMISCVRTSVSMPPTAQYEISPKVEPVSRKNYNGFWALSKISSGSLGHILGWVKPKDYSCKLQDVSHIQAVSDFMTYQERAADRATNRFRCRGRRALISQLLFDSWWDTHFMWRRKRSHIPSFNFPWIILW